MRNLFQDAFAMKVTAHETAECLAEFLADSCEDLPVATAAALAAAATGHDT